MTDAKLVDWAWAFGVVVEITAPRGGRWIVDKCPFCGAELQPWVIPQSEIKDYLCDTRTFVYAGASPVIGNSCYIRQIAALQSEVERLRGVLEEASEFVWYIANLVANLPYERWKDNLVTRAKDCYRAIQQALEVEKEPK